MPKLLRCALFFAVLNLLAVKPSLADELVLERTAADLLVQFRAEWDDDKWTTQRQFGVLYMRTDSDDGWQARMRLLQQLVAQGDDAVPALTEGLKSESIPVRILAAQALGYLPAATVAESLLTAAKSDPVPAVRLYAVDSLAMQGKTEGRVDWEAMLRNERNRDVRKHIGYAKIRAGEPLDPQVVRDLLAWNSQRMNTAQVGEPAPEFRLKSATGEQFQLSDFRGKQAVVLVFIYGDT